MIAHALEYLLRKLLKTNKVDYSLLDKEEILNNIRQVRNKFKNKEDLANLDSSELYELLSQEGIESEEVAGKIIMSARAHWFEEDGNTNE